MTCRTPVEPPVEPLSNPVCCTPLIPPAGYTACPPGWRAAACGGWTEDTRGQKETDNHAGAGTRGAAAENTRHAKGNASAAFSGRFSAIVKRIVHARPTRLDMGRQAAAAVFQSGGVCLQPLSRIKTGPACGASAAGWISHRHGEPVAGQGCSGFARAYRSEQAPGGCMSGRRSRSKGARTERGIVNALRASGIAAVRVPSLAPSAVASPAISFCRLWAVIFASR